MARNDITNDLIANTKGSAEKYAQGWEGIFGKAVREKPMEIGHFMVEPLPEPDWGRVDDLVEESRKWLKDSGSDELFKGIYESAAFTKEVAHKAFAGVQRKEHSVVMALDFHDSGKST